MIRTKAVKLTTLPNALATKKKFKQNNSGLLIITKTETATFTINKRNGSASPHGKVNTELFTDEVIKEALELTSKLGYKRLPAPAINLDNKEVKIEILEIDDSEDEQCDLDVINSVEYKEFIAEYSDKNDEFSYQLMNRALMKFAQRSGIVSKKIANKENVDLIVRYIVRSKAATLSRNKGMDKDMLTAFIDTFDSMCTRSAFKELRQYLRNQMSRKNNRKR